MNTHLGRTQWLKISIVALVRCLLLAGCMVVVSACTKPEQATPEVVPTATTLLPTPVPATPTASPAVETFTDFIPYTSKFHIQQVLSVRLPEEEDSVPPYPTILMFHSGAFEHGDKAELDELGLTLSESGMAVVNANYRLNRYPAPVEDAFCALAWVFREAPTYGFDTGHITAFGVDAGGTLAALLGLITDASDYLAACPNTTMPAHPVAGIVSYNAVYHYGFEEDYLDAWVTRYMDV